ncbi:MAG: hypothetical protein AAGN15_24055 [Cyanobacteria bacterium J06581_3]
MQELSERAEAAKNSPPPAKTLEEATARQEELSEAVTGCIEAGIDLEDCAQADVVMDSWHIE